MESRSESSPCGVSDCFDRLGNDNNNGLSGDEDGVSISFRKSKSDSRLDLARSKTIRSLYASMKAGFSLSPFEY
eukprot:2006854-Rhodomonas_salina.1